MAVNKKMNEKANAILSGAHAYIEAGIIRRVVTDDKELLAGERNNLDELFEGVEFVGIEDTRLLGIKEARESAVYLRRFESLKEAHRIFLDAGLHIIPHLHVDADTLRLDIVQVMSQMSAVAAYYELTAGNLGIRLCDKHADFDVTVIVPVYGVENFVEKCAVSLRDQSFRGRYEVLFANDGSKDRSVQIIERVIEGHPHMRVLSKPNGGAASARNFGIAAARGQYIAFVDGDDYVSSDYLDALYRAALVNNADISQAEFCFVNAATGEITPHREWFETVRGQFSPISRPASRMMLQTPGIWRRLYSRGLLERFGTLFNENFRRHDDLPFNIEVLSNAESVAISRVPVYFYSLGRDGQDVGASDERLFIHFRLFEYTKQRITRRYWDTGFYRDYLTTMFGHHLWAYERIESRLKDRYLRGVGQQVFGDQAPIGAFGRYKVLRRHFKNHRSLLRKAFLMSYFRTQSLPSDV